MTDTLDAPAIAEIPLPPDDLVQEMIAQDAGPAVRTPPRVESLQFVGGRPMAVAIPLDFPFLWEGRVVDTIAVRRMTTQAMTDLADRLGERLELFDVYAVMTGLPASVLRALEASDGTRVTEAAYDFLPRALRPGNA